MSEERATYGYCPNCGEAFDRPYTHCPFCNAPNPHLEQDLAKKKDSINDKLREQMEANRKWADANRAEVKAEVDARIEQNLKEMKSQIKSSTGSVTNSAKSKAKWILPILAILLLGIAVWFLLLR